MMEYANFSVTCSDELEKAILKWKNFLLNEKRFSKLTAKSYLMDLKEFMDFLKKYFEKELSFEDLKKMKITDFRAFLADSSRKEKARSSIARELSAVRNFFHFLNREKILENQAIKSIQTSAPPKILPKPLSQEEAKAFLKMAQKMAKVPWQQHRDVALYTLLYGCGLRIAEALSLNVGDFPLNQEAFVIKGKGNKERLIPILPFVQKVIKKYLGFYPNPDKEKPLFIGARYERLNPGVVQRNVRAIRRLLNLPESVTPHALRHSFATHILQNSGDLRAVQELLGHNSLAATQRYTEIDMVQLKNVYNKAHPRAQLLKEK